MSDEPLKIEFAVEEDLIDLIIIGQHFYEEGPFKGKAKEDPHWSLFAYVVDQAIQEKRLIVARDGIKIAGFVLLTQTYWLFPSGDLGEEIFYIKKEYRGTAAARGLRAGIKQYSEIMKPALGWGGSTSGFNDKIHQNMMERDGYIPLGRQCVKIYEETDDGQ